MVARYGSLNSVKIILGKLSENKKFKWIQLPYVGYKEVPNPPLNTHSQYDEWQSQVHSTFPNFPAEKAKPPIKMTFCEPPVTNQS